MAATLKVKICGITNAEDATVAVDAGADALGFVFYRKSPRYIEPTLARQIVMSLPPLVLPVGVFVDEEQQVVRNIMDDCGLALAQLHGNESAIYCKELGRTVLKALRVKDRSTFLALAEFRGRRDTAIAAKAADPLTITDADITTALSDAVWNGYAEAFFA